MRKMPKPSPGPVLGETGNVMFKTQIHQYLFPQQTQLRVVFFLFISLQLSPILLLLPHCGDLSRFNSSSSHCLGKLILTLIKFFIWLTVHIHNQLHWSNTEAVPCKGGKEQPGTHISQAAIASAAPLLYQAISIVSLLPTLLTCVRQISIPPLQNPSPIISDILHG